MSSFFCGGGGGGGGEEEKELRKVNKKIEKEIAMEKKMRRKEIKILLLGEKSISPPAPHPHTPRGLTAAGW